MFLSLYITDPTQCIVLAINYVSTIDCLCQETVVRHSSFYQNGLLMRKQQTNYFSSTFLLMTLIRFMSSPFNWYAAYSLQ